MQKFGAARVAQMVPFMKSVFESVGVNGYSLEGNVSSTLDSHRLLEHALLGPRLPPLLLRVVATRVGR